MKNKGFVMIKKYGFASAIIAAMLASTPALADVKAGVDAWGRGDYAAAVQQWRAPAIAGDADAQFNLGQAYKLGRGVPVDLKLAEEWYRKAAGQGHLQAEDNYGLMLFQNGDRQRALPIIEKSAGRGEPRAQYVFGTALFNGDMVAKDWPRAYALMTRASAAGLAPASASLAQMDKFIPLDQRQRGLAMAREFEARAARPQMAMTDLPPSRLPQAAPAPTPRPVPTFESSRPAESLPPISRAARDASKAASNAGREAQQSASRGWSTGGPSALPRPTERTRRPAPPEVAPEYNPLPAEPQVQPYPQASEYPQPMDVPPMADGPGTSYPVQDAYPAQEAYPPQSYPAPAPVVRSRPKPAPAPVVRKAPVAPAPVRAVSGGYRVQLGAFSDVNRAKALWSSLSRNVGSLKGMQPYLVKAGSITRLQAGPLGSKAAAEKLCGQVRSAAQSCLVVSE
jgi:uncharacterized protein